MKQRILAVIILSLYATLAFAGPDPAPTPVTIDTGTLQEFAGNVAKAGNFSLAISPGYAPKLDKGAWGLAVYGGYQINQYAGAFLRADLLDGNSYVASGSVALQYPITFGKFTVRPFVEAGVGSALGGAGDKNKSVFAIAGTGAAIDLYTSKDQRYSVSAFGGIETWEPVYHGISIYRGGIIGRVRF